ncbi:RecF/RecN/SMC protein [Exidia glandulosa HHB12029]|uniref:Structural maintenance of chromosomes protein n=1 Tax=Exidia glandulosa HHB12029 TaxID=1314781 RepID=A0A165LU52_EXIGL|nr:RecF/RecN/SMC protein [Exidia glandulosa HHB12029]
MVFIKTITIQGFKSYRDQTSIEPFSPRHNVVLGRNGSGKSNFFAAIRFVLSDAYTSMAREERASLLHEGVSTAQTLSAFVEIVFDNGDGRFPTGRDELVLRRTIGLKKDEYSLDRKSYSRADVMNMLESAGFSRSNPYYIVPQGRITALTNAKDAERLALLKEVAGTKVYEQKRTESLKIMEETNAKRTKINELLTYIEERLTDLEEEKKELADFQNADKERRCLEYALYQRELQDVTEALDEVEEERRTDVDSANKRRRLFTERESAIASLESSLSSLKQERTVLSLTRTGLKAEMDELVRARTELRCIVEDLEKASENSNEKRSDLESELSSLTKRITSVERELSTLETRFTSARDKESTERRALDSAQTQLEVLGAKRGRASQFRTKSERDAYLKAEIQSIEAFVGSQEGHGQELERLVREEGERAGREERREEEVRRAMEERSGKVREMQERAGGVREKVAELVEERKELWREETRLEQNVTHAQNELRSAERSLASMMDKDTGSGLQAVERIKNRLKGEMDGVYGPLYKLFEIPDRKYSVAVELTAGNSLFHVVVDNDTTAQRVLDVMLKEKTGRVTFMPLNRLKPKPQTFPPGGDAVPLIDKLTYDDAYGKAMQQVFGRTAVCRDLNVAAAYVRSHGLNTITLDGDKVDRKGALTGGFHDVRRSRIDAVRSVRNWLEKYTAENERLSEVRERATKLDAEITKLNGETAVLQQQISKLLNGAEGLRMDAARARGEVEKAREKVRRAEADKGEVEAEVTAMRAKVEAYRKEMASPMERALSREEEAALARLGKEVEERKVKLAALRKERSEAGGKRELLEIELNESLRRRRDELKAKMDAIAADSGTSADAASAGADLESRRRELKTLVASIEEMQKKLRDTEASLESLTTEVQSKTAELEEAQARQGEDSRGMAKQQKHAERYLAKRAMLIGRRDEVNRSIRDLGVLPEEAFEKYTSAKMDNLVKKLHAVNEKLKEFAHVNKKAFEQYGSFTKQRDSLLERRKDLDSSAASIEELIDILDQRKDEAIDRTFKQVAKNFEEVFEQLVPAGRGRLIIQRKVDNDPEQDDEEEDTQQSAVDNYTGVSIKVSFNSKVDEGLRIQQLSGGQKSLVALATVFAIQKCDPAPFYLFDEIDANLDAQYRTAVAQMIKKLAGTAQFIATTFRPEMLETADKFYGVMFDNQKVSSIRTITREDAREFVEQEAMAQ